MSTFDRQSVLSWTIRQEFGAKVGRAWPGMMSMGGWQVELKALLAAQFWAIILATSYQLSGEVLDRLSGDSSNCPTLQ